MKNVIIERYLHRRKSLRSQYFTPATPFHPRKMAAEVSQGRGIDGTHTPHNSIRVYTYIQFIESDESDKTRKELAYPKQKKTLHPIDPERTPPPPQNLNILRIHLPILGEYRGDW